MDEHKEKKNILWIGALSWLNADLTYFPNASYPGIVSGSAFQQSIIEGFEQHGNDVQILTDCDMGSGERLEWSHNDKSKDIRVAGKSNKILRIIKKTQGLKRELRKTKILANKDVVLAYEMHLPYLFALKKIKRINKNIPTILICPDLSLYMDVNSKNKPLKRFLKKIENWMMKKLLQYVDGVVLFTEQMNDYFSFKRLPYVVVEGVCRNKFSLEVKQKKNYILHAGSLHKNTGIEQLIDAFERLEENDLELWFCGSGAMDEYILAKAKQNKKIKHLGFVNPTLLFEYEKEALMLVNVRDPKEEYTKYSFPSKTFEFMLSGTITLCTELPGIPSEYKEHLIMISSNKVEEIIAGIHLIMDMKEEDRLNFGLKARKFALEEKNQYIQSGKIIQFIDSLLNNQKECK